MQDRALLQVVSWFSQNMTERPVQVQHTWRLDLHGQFSYQRQTNGRNAACFYSPCEQSNELRAEASGRHQQGEINPCLLHPHPHLVRRGRIFLRVLC